MIPVNELRIGNWVQSAEEYKEVHGIDDDVLFKGRESCELSDVAPISLTPAILEKCGFKNKSTVEGLGFFENDKYRLEDWFSGKGYSVRLKISKNESYHFAAVEYLHQLQNLYFALTGIELIDVLKIGKNTLK